jgi:putative endonuclease
VLERNWRAGNSLRGEIDCIARHGKTLCFVEVKTRASNEHGAPQKPSRAASSASYHGLAKRLRVDASPG